MPPSLGDTLRSLRQRKGWSQRDLARVAKVRQALISELEMGRKQDTTFQNVRKLAVALEVSVDYLAGLPQKGGQIPGPKRRTEARTFRWHGRLVLPLMILLLAVHLR